MKLNKVVAKLAFISIAGFCPTYVFSAPLASGAKMFEGVVTYDAYGRTNVGFSSREKFSIIINDDHWLINTELLSTTPPLMRPELFCPKRQEMGSDGLDLYYFKTLGSSTNLYYVGWVEPGIFPSMRQSPSLSVLWLAFASRTLFAGEKVKFLSPLWGTSAENKEREQKCVVNIRYSLLTEKPRFLSELYFLSDGRISLCDVTKTNRYADPWGASGFAQGLFKVSTTQTLEQDYVYPSLFSFEVVAPEAKPKEPQLRTVSRVYAEITNAVTIKSPDGWLPALPTGNRIGVVDYRFTKSVTNWDYVAYNITNQWLARTSRVLQASVAVLTKSKPAQ